MGNNYSSLKCDIRYSLVSAIISKLNIFPSKQTFHIHLTIKVVKIGILHKIVGGMWDRES